MMEKQVIFSCIQLLQYTNLQLIWALLLPQTPGGSAAPITMEGWLRYAIFTCLPNALCTRPTMLAISLLKVLQLYLTFLLKECTRSELERNSVLILWIKLGKIKEDVDTVYASRMTLDENGLFFLFAWELHLDSVCLPDLFPYTSVRNQVVRYLPVYGGRSLGIPKLCLFFTWQCTNCSAVYWNTV